MLYKAVILLSAAICCRAQSLDPAFKKAPVDDWFAQGKSAGINWSVQIAKPQLSVFQRLTATIHVEVDGRELEKRLSSGGEMVVFVQIEDGVGRPYQNHEALDLRKMQEGVRSSNISVDMNAFVLPGSYNIRTAIYFTATHEHAVKSDSVRVSPFSGDPLPEMWRNLPPVEFLTSAEPPESWYLPGETGRRYLPAASEKAVRADVIFNLSPSERLSGSGRTLSRNLGTLLPALKTISDIDLGNGVMNIEMLDLARQKVAFHQEEVHKLDWARLTSGLTESNPAVIDVKSLENRQANAGFFVSEVSRVAQQPAPAHAVIILSAPVEFESGQNIQPITTSAPPGLHIYYIRYRIAVRPKLASPAFDPYGAMGRRRVGMGGRPGGYPPGGSNRVLVDQLESTIKPLSPRLFDVDSPEAFRKALAAIIQDIGRM